MVQTQIYTERERPYYLAMCVRPFRECLALKRRILVEKKNALIRWNGRARQREKEIPREPHEVQLNEQQFRRAKERDKEKVYEEMN